ncbi:unnamed protein product, partial [Rotaria socialis]
RNALNYGTSAFVSFHHTKPIGFGEGGAVIIDRKYEMAVRQSINFGYDVPKGDVRWLAEGSNYKMSDVQAAFIYAYLDTFHDILDANMSLYERLKQEIYKLNIDINFLPNFSSTTPFTSCCPVLFKRSIEESLLKLVACEDSIDIRKYYKPLISIRSLAPVSYDVYDHIVCFPCHSQMTDQDVLKILHVIQKLHEKSLVV